MNSHLRWTSHLLRAYHHIGVRHVILSPGSRSTPLTLAAAIHKGFRKKIVIDERSAAFMALGIGKATGIPAILICTSGTAAANYLPAVTEARESGVPVIILTADRPPNLRGIGSSQTVDQIKFFGDQSVFFHEAGEPAFSDIDLRRLSYLAKQSFDESIKIGGAAHINLPFRKPLEPKSGDIDSEQELNMKQDSDVIQSVQGITKRTIHLSTEVSEWIKKSVKPLIVAGPANSHHALNQQLINLAEKISSPVIAEPGSAVDPPSEFLVNRYEQFLGSSGNLKMLKPDLIIRFGDQPFTKSLLTAFEHWSIDNIPVLHLQSRISAQDHAMSVSHAIFCSREDDLILPEPLHSNRESAQWLNSWKVAERSAGETLDQAMRVETGFTDGHVFYQLSKRIGKDWNVMLSNSFIPRDMALFGHASVNQFVNRGAAGIDGIISTSAGILEATNRPTLCITGDIAFLHDSNALLSAKNAGQPFVILVINNGGGNIFRMLPVYQYEEYYLEYFETPQQVEIMHLAEAHSLDYKLIDSVDALKNFDLTDCKGTSIIECKTDADASMNLRRKLWYT